MSLRGIVDRLQEYPPVRRIGELAGDPSAEFVVINAPAAAHALVTAEIHQAASSPTILVTTSGQSAEDLAGMELEELDAAVDAMTCEADRRAGRREPDAG